MQCRTTFIVVAATNSRTSHCNDARLQLAAKLKYGRKKGQEVRFISRRNYRM